MLGAAPRIEEGVVAQLVLWVIVSTTDTDTDTDTSTECSINLSRVRHFDV